LPRLEDPGHGAAAEHGARVADAVEEPRGRARRALAAEVERGDAADDRVSAVEEKARRGHEAEDDGLDGRAEEARDGARVPEREERARGGDEERGHDGRATALEEPVREPAGRERARAAEDREDHRLERRRAARGALVLEVEGQPVVERLAQER